MHHSFLFIGLLAVAICAFSISAFRSRKMKETEQPFLMQVLSRWRINVKGNPHVVVCGRISRGSIKIGQELEVINDAGVLQKATVNDIEMLEEKYGFTAKAAKAGDAVGLQLIGLNFDKIELRQFRILVQPGTWNPEIDLLILRHIPHK